MLPTTIFDVPVNVKFVAVNISNSSLALPFPVSVIEPDVPNAIDRIIVLSDIKAGVVNPKLFKSSVPEVSVKTSVGVPPTIRQSSLSVVVVVAPPNISKLLIPLPFEVSVPLPIVLKSVFVYIPADASVNP